MTKKPQKIDLWWVVIFWLATLGCLWLATQ